jgi:hypothetical protein
MRCGEEGNDPMPKFDVRFLKTVTDDTGHDRVVCQCHFEVQAADPIDATRWAKTAFCRRREIQCWSTHGR